MAADAGSGERAGESRLLRWRAPLVAPLVLAAVLAGAAVVTVERTGCDTPGRYVSTAAGVEYVGGCLPLDLPVVPHAPGPPTRPGDEWDARRG